MKMEDDLLKPKQVRKLLNASQSKVYKMAADGQLPCIRIPCPGVGKRKKYLVRFRMADIQEFIEKHYQK